MRIARPLLAAAALGLAVSGVTGCEQAQERAEQEASEAAASAIKSQICSLIGDGELSDAELKALSQILDRAHDINVPDDVLNPAHEIVTAGEATTAKINELKSGCA
jgi:hypothetical protein